MIIFIVLERLGLTDATSLKDAAKHGQAARGDREVRQDENVSVCVWRDTQPVTFISFGHNPAHTKVIRRKLRMAAQLMLIALCLLSTITCLWEV